VLRGTISLVTMTGGCGRYPQLPWEKLDAEVDRCDAARREQAGKLRGITINIKYCSSVDLSQPHLVNKLRSCFEDWLPHFPNDAETTIELGGVDHLLTYEVKDDCVEAIVLCDDVEALLTQTLNIETINIEIQPEGSPSRFGQVSR
jgi:hypothetical protein